MNICHTSCGIVKLSYVKNNIYNNLNNLHLSFLFQNIFYISNTGMWFACVVSFFVVAVDMI